MNKELKPFIIKQRKLIINTLVILLLIKPYDTITVTEVCSVANINRQTFYNNFKSKDDVLNNYMDYLENEYMTILKAEKQIPTYCSTKIYFQFWQERHRFLQILIRDKLFHKLFAQYKNFCNFSFISTPKQQSSDNELESYKHHSSLIGFFYILILWAKKGAKTAPEKMATIVSSLVQ